MFYPIPEMSRWLLFILLAPLSLVLMIPAGGRLNSKRTPLGIVALELAGTPRKARQVIAAWDVAAQQRAKAAVRLDYLFLVTYSTAVSLACMLAAGRWHKRSRMARTGIVLAWAQWVAGLLDAVENAALLRMLQGRLEQPWPRIAQTCAVPKFAIVGLGLLYALASWLAGR